MSTFCPTLFQKFRLSAACGLSAMVCRVTASVRLYRSMTLRRAARLMSSPLFCVESLAVTAVSRLTVIANRPLLSAVR